LPAPAHRIPIWMGGRSAAAIDRAVRHDGFHAINIKPEEAKAMVDELRARRADPDFIISLRVSWDVTKMEPSAMAEEADVYRQAGIGALLVAPERGDIETWVDGQETVAKALLSPRT
jgi:alkanesulfonate monooxygenase SsuD/methylene tetrahydromethanopterin reductase-like flavin-dependent oxidoreductase (luciferase family)